MTKTAKLVLCNRGIYDVVGYSIITKTGIDEHIQRALDRLVSRTCMVYHFTDPLIPRFIPECIDEETSHPWDLHFMCDLVKDNPKICYIDTQGIESCYYDSNGIPECVEKYYNGVLLVDYETPSPESIMKAFTEVIPTVEFTLN